MRTIHDSMKMLKILFVCYLCGLTLIQKAKENIPYSMDVMGKTFFMSKAKMTYEDAETFCFVRGGRLIAEGIRNDTLWAKLRAKLSRSNKHIWVVLSDRVSERRWVFSDGVVAGNKVIALWNLREPDGGINENCAKTYADVNYLLVDKACTATRRAYCEMP